METRKVLQKFIFWLPSPRWCFLNRSCYITSFELVQVGSSAWSHFWDVPLPGCFRLLQRWAGGPDRIQAILVAFFLFWAQGKIYRFTLFDSDFDLGSSTNHHIDFVTVTVKRVWNGGKLQVVHCESCPRTEWQLARFEWESLVIFLMLAMTDRWSRLACLRRCYLWQLNCGSKIRWTAFVS